MSAAEQKMKKVIFVNEEMDEEIFQKRLHGLLIKYVDKKPAKITNEYEVLEEYIDGYKIGDSDVHGNIIPNTELLTRKLKSHFAWWMGYHDGFENARQDIKSKRCRKKAKTLKNNFKGNLPDNK